MKYLKNTFLLFLVIFSCTNETFESQKYLELKADKNQLNFKINSNEKISFISNLNNGKVTSSLNFKSDNTTYSIKYNIDVNISHWKLKQADKVILKSEELISKRIDSKTLSDLTNSLEIFYKDNYHTLSNNSDPILISMLNYYKSIFNVAKSSIENNNDCECTVHPAFLLEKINFNCQEEQYIDVNDLKSILNDYKVSNVSIDNSTENLIQFLDKTNKLQIRFDDYYSYYISKEDYNNTLTNFLNPVKSSQTVNRGDCAWWCPLGCGSDHGCCGNYSGCCLYIHVTCYVHDKLCTNCKPAWFCLSGCVPDEEITDAP